jgi:hypothetical protein
MSKSTTVCCGKTYKDATVLDILKIISDNTDSKFINLDDRKSTNESE